MRKARREKKKEQKAAVAAENPERPSSSMLEAISSDDDPDLSLDLVQPNKIDMTNTYHKLASTDWYQFSPKQIKGIAAMVEQMSPSSATQYCQIAVSTDKTPDDTDKLRTMVFNGLGMTWKDLL